MTRCVQTVLGPVDVGELGRILPHEHIPNPPELVKGSLDQSECQVALDHIVPVYRQLVDVHECRTIVECTPARDGQMIPLMQEISRASGMHLVCTTGFYLEHTRPDDFVDRPVHRVAERMIGDVTEGIGNTGVRAGLVKIAVHQMGESDRLLCRAAAIAQKETGASITTHACTPQTRRSLVDLLDGLGVPPERVYIGHADNGASVPELLGFVQRGFNVLLTTWGIVDPEALYFWPYTYPVPRYHSAGLVAGLVAEGYIGRVTFSMDASSRVKGDELRQDLYAMSSRTSLYLFENDFCGTRTFGLTDGQLDQMMRVNPTTMLCWNA